MLNLQTQRRKLAMAVLGLGVTLGLSVLGTGTAEAHFMLVAPDAYSKQDADPYGSPQKAPPCGLTDPVTPSQLTGLVTNYVAGQKITLTIDEKIPHPGWYRVAIAKDQASLPAEPPVTAGSTACGSTTIDPNPQLPLLADGLFQHTSAFTSPQTAQIQLPPGFTCQNCVLQVIEWMSNHGLNNPGGCFYHHCATVNITAAAGTDGGSGTPDAGGSGTDDAGTGGGGGGGGQSTGCSYHPAAGSLPEIASVLSALGIGLLLRRRRRAV